MAGDVTLTAALRSNLLSLQSTQRLLNQTQLRLATGKKVNSALDNANAYFASQSLNNRAKDLSRMLDGIGQGVQALKATDEGIKSMTSFLEQMQAVAREALDQARASDDGEPVDRASLESSFNELRRQLDFISRDAGYRGTNLLGGSSMTVYFNETRTSSLTVTGVDFTADGALAIGAANFADIGDIETALEEIRAAMTLVRAQARSFGTNLNIIQTREDFTRNLINTLKEGSDKLVLADTNEEAAKLLALQTQLQLGITSQSLASPAQEAVLRLFRL